MYVTSYSKKMDNVNNDLKLELPLMHFEEIDENGYFKGHTTNYLVVKVKTNKNLENIRLLNNK